jgi:hypothetical protein
MATSDADAEAWVLTTAEGRALLADVAAVSRPGPAEITRWRSLATADHVAAAIRLAACRLRARAKFTRADQMWLEPVGLEQATAEPVSRHKARRFGAELVVDLCSGIGGDTLALAAEGRVLAVDLDPAMCRRTLWNAAVHGAAGRVAAIRARAEAFGLPAGALVHVDPDRRARPGRRAQTVADYQPGLVFLQDLPARCPGGAIKLGPASDFAAHFGAPAFEVEVVSLAGECKEATVWFGSLAGCRRRATRLPEQATWTDRDGPPNPRVAVARPCRWIYDPDPALGRAGLLEAFAAAHGLARCVEGVDLLTSSECLASPWLAAFETLEVLPLDLKRLRRLVRERGLGSLEIKTRGFDLTPERLRIELRPEGPEAATLLLVRGTETAVAVLARRPGPTPADPA